jgi:type IV pilus assembly protein PilB
MRPQRPVARERLGEMLVRAGLLTDEKLAQALSMAQRAGDRLGDVLVRAGFARPEEIASALAKQFGVEYLPAATLGTELVDRGAFDRAGLPLLRKHRVIPIVYRGHRQLAIADPLNTVGTDEVQAKIGDRPFLVTTRRAIDLVLQVIAFEAVDSERII